MSCLNTYWYNFVFFSKIIIIVLAAITKIIEQKMIVLQVRKYVWVSLFLFSTFSLFASKYSPVSPAVKDTLSSKKEFLDHPASDIYENIWSTTNPHPYPANFADNDTLLRLTLINDSSDFHLPGVGVLSSAYGWRDDRFHPGVDLAVYHGLPIYAVFPGVVRFARNYGGYGRIVIIRHDNGLETYYAHLSRIGVKAGERVKAGDIIGNSGNSGSSYNTHLHFEIRYKGVAFNPAHVINFKEQQLKFTEVIMRKTKTNYFVYTDDAILYTIKRGDYLYKIAAEFGTTVRKIREDNDLNQKSILRSGQILKIYL